MQVVISETILLANLAVFEPGEGEANRRAAPALDSSLGKRSRLAVASKIILLIDQQIDSSPCR